jgi:hypothetical protein
VVPPGDSLALDLVAAPTHPFREQRLRFSIHSRTSEVEDAPTVVDEQVLLIPGVPLLRRLTPFVLLILGAAAVPLIVLWLVRAIS